MSNSPSPRQRRGHGRVTLSDVAASAGVTAVTVSRFLRTPEQVASTTAKTIRAALRATGYVPNRQAGLLASGAGSNIVAALLPNLAQSIFAETVQGLSDTLATAQLELLIGATGYSIEREESQLRALLGWHPRAVIVTGHDHTPGALKLLRDAQRRGVVVVEVWDHIGTRRGFVQIGINHRRAGQATARHLIARGRRRLVYVDSAVPMDFRAQTRGDAFVATALEAGAHVERLVAPAGDPMDAGRAVLRELLARPQLPDACAMANDNVACGALLQALADGIAVPERLALMGFGDFPLSRQLRPALTTMAPPRREIGEAAASWVLAAMRGEADVPFPAELPCPVVQRGST